MQEPALPTQVAQTGEQGLQSLLSLTSPNSFSQVQVVEQELVSEIPQNPKGQVATQVEELRKSGEAQLVQVFDDDEHFWQGDIHGSMLPVPSVFKSEMKK